MGPSPTGAAPGPSKSRADRYVFGWHINPRADPLLRTQVSPEAIWFPLRPYIEALGPRLRGGSIRSGLLTSPLERSSFGLRSQRRSGR